MLKDTTTYTFVPTDNSCSIKLEADKLLKVLLDYNECHCHSSKQTGNTSKQKEPT